MVARFKTNEYSRLVPSNSLYIYIYIVPCKYGIHHCYFLFFQQSIGRECWNWWMFRTRFWWRSWIAGLLLLTASLSGQTEAFVTSATVMVTVTVTAAVSFIKRTANSMEIWTWTKDENIDSNSGTCQCRSNENVCGSFFLWTTPVFRKLETAGLRYRLQLSLGIWLLGHV